MLVISLIIYSGHGSDWLVRVLIMIRNLRISKILGHGWEELLLEKAILYPSTNSTSDKSSPARIYSPIDYLIQSQWCFE